MIKTTIAGVIDNFLEWNGLTEYYLNKTETIVCTGRWLASNVHGRRIPFAYTTEEDIVMLFREVGCYEARYYPHANKVIAQAKKKGVKVLEINNLDIFNDLMLTTNAEMERAVSSLYTTYRPEEGYHAVIPASEVEVARFIIEGAK